MVDRGLISSIKRDKLILNNNNQFWIGNNEGIHEKFLNKKTIDIASRLGQFAWRQVTSSTIQLPVIFRHYCREEYLCVQMIKIHLLSKFSPEIISYCMNQLPIHYFSLTVHEANLFQYINKFHSNGFLSNKKQLNYSQSDSAYITPYLPFVEFYQFVSSYSQSIKNNGLPVTPKSNKSNTDREKQNMNNNCSSNKIISSSPNITSSSNSYCQSILFRGRKIVSYSTRSSIDSNEAITCLSIKDIISTYFPWATPEKFVQLCRIKQIVRYKPDIPTNSNFSLRLINARQLDQDWDFFIEQLLPKIPSHQSLLTEDINDKSSDKSSLPSIDDKNDNSSIPSSDIIEKSVQNTTNIVSLSSEEHSILSQHKQNSPCPMDTNQTIDDEHFHCIINSLINQQIDIVIENEQQQLQQENLLENNTDKEQNQLEIDSTENKQEETALSTIENNPIKKKRRRTRSHFTFAKRHKRNTRINNQIQKWINKYSIEPISIFLQRVDIPID